MSTAIVTPPRDPEPVQKCTLYVHTTPALAEATVKDHQIVRDALGRGDRVILMRLTSGRAVPWGEVIADDSQGR